MTLLYLIAGAIALTASKALDVIELVLRTLADGAQWLSEECTGLAFSIAMGRL